jgi:hypothetical protein
MPILRPGGTPRDDDTDDGVWDPSGRRTALYGYRKIPGTRHRPRRRVGPLELDEAVERFAGLALRAMALTAALHAALKAFRRAFDDATDAVGVALAVLRFPLLWMVEFGLGMLAVLLTIGPIVLAGAPAWIGLARLGRAWGAGPRLAEMAAAAVVALLAVLFCRLVGAAGSDAALPLAVLGPAVAAGIVARAHGAPR